MTVTDSIVVVNEIALCDGESYFAEGEDQTETGTYYDYYVAESGCDSTVVLNLLSILLIIFLMKHTYAAAIVSSLKMNGKLQKEHILTIS